MDIFEFREFCLRTLPLTEEATPFDETTLVFKVQGKMFALCDMDDFSWINLKCDPDKAVEQRERYHEWIKPGFHMNKNHWNTVSVAGDLSDAFLRELIRDSYLLVVNGLPRAKKAEVLEAL